MLVSITSDLRTRAERWVAWAGALTGAIMLALQFGLVVGSMEASGSSWGAALWRFIGFFTIIMNISATLVMTHAALRPNVRTGLGNPRVEFAVATAMGIVAIVYSVALRSIWNPQGWQLVADHGLHDVMPALLLLFWFLRPHGRLRTRDTLWALVLPVAYCFYAMIRGAFDGWYAYHFLDAAALDAGTLARNIAILCVAFLGVALVLTGADRLLGRRWSPRIAA